MRNSQSLPVYDPVRFEAIRWSIYLVLAVAYMSVFFHRMAPGVVSADLMIAFNTTGVALGSLAAMYYYIYTAMQIPAGILADTVGTRAAVTVGNLVAGVGSLLFGMAENLEAASFGRFLVGLGVSVVFVGLMKSNAVWFSERRYGLVSGLTLFLGNIGAMLAAGPLALMLDVWSWREIFVTIGIGSLGLSVLSLAVVRNRPEQAGFPSLRAMEGKPPHAEREHHWLEDLRRVVARREAWPGFFVNFGICGGLFSFAGLWAVPLLRDVHGLTRDEASFYTTTTLFGMALGALGSGALADYLRARKPVLMGGTLLYLLAVAALTWLPWVPGISTLTLFGLLGIGGGSFVVTYPAAKEVCPPAVSGMAISLVNTGLFLGAALMQPLFGWALDLGWDGTMKDELRVYAISDYRHGLWLMAGFALVALIASLRIRETGARNLTVA